MCNDIDSVAAPLFEAKAAFTDGSAYVGIKNTTGPLGRDFTWYDLTQNPGYPANACSISISELSQVIRVEVLTTDGVPYETACTVEYHEGSVAYLVCDGVWEQQSVPQLGAANALGLIGGREPFDRHLRHKDTSRKATSKARHGSAAKALNHPTEKKQP